jgi:TetR/AcrR family transcriptional repressor of nem operon
LAGPKSQFDAIFSATVAPLERLSQFCDLAYRKQTSAKRECGRILGCPLYMLTQRFARKSSGSAARSRKSAYHRKYIERRPGCAGRRPGRSARRGGKGTAMIHAYYEGLLTQARIQNDAEVLRELERGVFSILGVKQLYQRAA